MPRQFIHNFHAFIILPVSNKHGTNGLVSDLKDEENKKQTRREKTNDMKNKTNLRIVDIYHFILKNKVIAFARFYLQLIE